MELSTQIKKYRTQMNYSQEALAEKVYVTRQTVSNWENNKNYPDIHSLLLLSALFDISLDQLIKGDIDMMKNEIQAAEVQRFNQYSKVFSLLFLLTIFSCVPLVIFLKYVGIAIWVTLFSVTLYYALKVEQFKKANHIQTYKEIVAFTEGKRLDEIERLQEYGKRPYQKLLLAMGSMVLTLVVCLALGWLLRSLL